MDGVYEVFFNTSSKGCDLRFIGLVGCVSGSGWCASRGPAFPYFDSGYNQEVSRLECTIRLGADVVYNVLPALLYQAVIEHDETLGCEVVELRVIADLSVCDLLLWWFGKACVCKVKVVLSS